MFLDELTQEELDNYENRLIDIIKLTISTLYRQRTRRETSYGSSYYVNRELKVKYKHWTLPFTSHDLTVRGTTHNGAFNIWYNINSEYNPNDEIHLQSFYGVYRKNIILREICERYQLTTVAKFEEFINKINASVISIV